MTVETAAPVAAAPAAATAPVAVDSVGSRVVLFDFDGVLIHGDAFYLFMRYRYAHSPSRVLLALVAMPLLLLLIGFSRRRSMHLLIRIALLGQSEQRYAAAAAEFAALLARRPRQFCRDAVRALRAHQVAGDRVLIVTGCEQQLADAIVQQLGLSQLETLGSQLQHGWSGMRMHRHNVGASKLQRLKAADVSAWQVAYSDSVQDVPMLRPAAEAVLVNGTPGLCKRVEKALGRSITRVQWR